MQCSVYEIMDFACLILVEHILFVKFTSQSLPSSTNIREAIDLYLKYNFPYIFDNIEYNSCFGIMAEVIIERLLMIRLIKQY